MRHVCKSKIRSRPVDGNPVHPEPTPGAQSTSNRGEEVMVFTPNANDLLSILPAQFCSVGLFFYSFSCVSFQ